MMMSGFDFEGKGPFRRPSRDSFKIDAAETQRSAVDAANKLIAQQGSLSDDQVSAWKVTGDVTQIGQRLLSWEAGEDPEYTETPLAQRIAYAKEYLDLLKKGIA